MALGNKNAVDGELILLKYRSKDADGKKVAPFFEVSRKSDGEFQKTDEKYPSVSGNLIKLETGGYEYEDEFVRTVKLLLKDEEANEVYSLDFGYNMATRGFFNSLLSLKQTENISVSLYEVQDKKDKSKKYPAISLWDNSGEEGEMMRWRFQLDELPETEVITDKKGKVIKYDTEEVDEFFQKQLQKLSLKLFGNSNQRKVSSKKAAVDEEEVEGNEEHEEEKKPRKSTQTKSKVVEVEDGDDDVPF